jgi:outer membrane biosynthesis protein TonB
MVSKASEYRREYRPASLVKNIPTYYESLTYRHHRRELEYAHTPISWELDSEDKTEAPEEDDIPVVNLKIEEKDGKKDVEKGKEMTNEEEDEEENDAEEFSKEEGKEEMAVNCDQRKKSVEEVDRSDVLIERQTSESRELTKLAKNKLKKYSCVENRNNDRIKPSQDKQLIKGRDLVRHPRTNTKYRIYSPISRYFGSSILVQKSMSDL